MERRTFFVDVVLPLAIPNLLTYRVPQDMAEFIRVGQRIVVPLGKQKLHTGLVRAVHENPPQEHAARYVEGILDEHPIVHEGQFRLWEWMAQYYVCSTGEVMSAALPGAFKLASETRIVLVDHWDGSETELSDKEFLIYEALQIQGVLSLKEIADLLGQQTVHPHVQSLMRKGAVWSEEELKERFVPRKETFVSLHPSLRGNDAQLQAHFDALEKRSPRQLEALMSFFHLTGSQPDEERMVSRKKLQRRAGVDSSIIRKLADKNIFAQEEREVGRLPAFRDAGSTASPLSPSQALAFEHVQTAWETQDCVLLHGVTGSGKTEVYIQLMQEALDTGKQVLFLVPEIALTTQLTQRLRRVFGDRVGVYHSRFNPNERVEIWHAVHQRTQGRYDIIVGARSSVFLPFTDLGLVIVDEEHESSYKQFDPAPRYHGRDVALVLAKLHKARVLLGSATPSLESYAHAADQKYGLVEMTERFSGVALPEIFIGDIRQELKQKSMKGIFTEFLLQHMRETLQAGQQIILFQNRRGYTPLWQCQVCGEIPECKRCDVSLTYHKQAHQLRCHYCGYSEPAPSTCDHCGNHNLKMLGFGTEKIQEEVEVHFPDVKCERLDLETTRSRNAYERIIAAFADRDIQILVGTQMVSKGLDFDNVGLVGVLNADQMLKFPDFRSFERGFQLLSQVAGRSGRREQRGKVVIQTYTPDHWVLRRVVEHDFQGLFAQEMPERKNFLYPPYYRLIRITLKHRDPQVADRASLRMAGKLREALGDRVLGPEKPYVARINNHFLRTVLVKVEKTASPHAVKQRIRQEQHLLLTEPDFKATRISIDVDPY